MTPKESLHKGGFSTHLNPWHSDCRRWSWDDGRRRRSLFEEIASFYLEIWICLIIWKGMCSKSMQMYFSWYFTQSLVEVLVEFLSKARLVKSLKIMLMQSSEKRNSDNSLVGKLNTVCDLRRKEQRSFVLLQVLHIAGRQTTKYIEENST